MPHSSGGGSHGGGSHGGSGGGGSSKPSMGPMRHYTPGCHTYVRYYHHRPHFYYCYGGFVEMRHTVLHAVLSIPVYLIIIAIFLYAMHESHHVPVKLSGTESNEIIIQDTHGVLGDTTALLDELTEFKEATGITPAVIASYNSEWTGSAENHAYELYLNELPDETYWLIFYSTDPDATGYTADWYWEGTQGNDTDDILTESVTSAFTDNLQDYLYQFSKYPTPASAITKAFSDITPTIMDESMDWGQFLLCGLVVIAMVVTSIATVVKALVWYRVKEDDFKEVHDNTGTPGTVTCRSCGGEYVKGDGKCPYCGRSEF